ncbi:hypothetical protein MASR2M44_22800 [Bacteroidota bacterium]
MKSTLIFAKKKIMATTRLKRKDRRNKVTSVLRNTRIKVNTELVKVKSPNKEKTVIID